MLRLLLLSTLLGASSLTLAACGDGNPFYPEEESPGNGEGNGDGDCVLCGDPDLPPGTEEPTPQSRITRHEARNGQGGGYVSSVNYRSSDDTFAVDGLAFDGDNIYDRGTAVGTLASGAGNPGYAVYEAREVGYDSETGAPIGQFGYRALYGVSRTPTSSGQPASRFAIVRTGDYNGYGFGGYLYERNGSVTLPASGFAQFTGAYAGMRIAQSRPGIEYVRGDMTIDIDFDDFDDGNGLRGSIANRTAVDINGNSVVSGTGEGQLPLPTLRFVVGPGVMTDNGEISAGINSYTTDESGQPQIYENGTYYGVLSGSGASMEIVGIIVVESTDPRYDTGVQETGGFIVYR